MSNSDKHNLSFVNNGVCNIELLLNYVVLFHQSALCIEQNVQSVKILKFKVSFFETS